MMEECIQRNWRGVVYNRRGHAGTSLLPEEYEEEEHFAKPFPVHADVEDMTAVIEHITKKYPRGRIVCVGFSLGSNLMVRYLGNSKSGCGAVAGVSVANGFDMVEGTKRLQSKGDWDAIITMKMKRLLVRHSEDLVKTRRMAPEHVKEIVKSKSFREFDAIVMGHLYGYEDVDEYYRENSCVHLLHDIEVPLLCLGDQDDPLLTQELLRSSLDAGKVNRHIITALTRNGGHLGWIEGWTGRPWMSRVIGEYIHAVLARDPAASIPSPFSAAAAAVPQPTLAPIESVPSETPSTATAHLSLADIDVDTSHHSDAPSPDDGTTSSVVEMDGVVAHPTLDGLFSTDGEGEGVESRTTTEGIASSNVEVEEQSPSLDSTGRVDTLQAVKVGGSEAVELYATATAVEAVPQDSTMVGM
jgi:predicted alpha/beta-fold hydrolase